MKININIQIIKFILLCAVTLIVNVGLVSAQEKLNEYPKEIVTFLNSSEELRNYSVNGFTSQFTGDFRSVPIELQSELSQSFPQYKFYIAKMTVLIDAPSQKYDLILVTNAVSKEIEGFVWANYWMLRPSKTFDLLLKGHQARSNEDAINQVRTFARLLVFANSDKIGDAKIQNGKIRVELIRGENVFSILEVGINRCMQFNRLVFIQPNGEKLKYFV